MFAANPVKDLSRRTSTSAGYVVEPLANAFRSIGAGGNVEQALVSFGILDDGRCFPFHCQHHGAPGFLELSHEVAGAPAKSRQGLDIVRDVKHGTTPMEAPF